MTGTTTSGNVKKRKSNDLRGEIEEERQEDYDRDRPRATRRKRAPPTRLDDASEWNKVMLAPQLLKAPQPRGVKRDKKRERNPRPPKAASPRARLPRSSSKGIGCPKCRMSRNGCNACGHYVYPERSSFPRKKETKKGKGTCIAGGEHGKKKAHVENQSQKSLLLIEDAVGMKRPLRKGKGMPAVRLCDASEWKKVMEAPQLRSKAGGKHSKKKTHHVEKHIEESPIMIEDAIGLDRSQRKRRRKGKGMPAVRLCDASEWKKVMEAPQHLSMKSKNPSKGKASTCKENEEAFEPKLGVWWNTESGGKFFYGVVVEQKADSYRMMYEDGDISWHTLCEEKLDLSKCFPHFLSNRQKMNFISNANMCDLPILRERGRVSKTFHEVSTGKSKSIAMMIKDDDDAQEVKVKQAPRGSIQRQLQLELQCGKGKGKGKGKGEARCETCADCFTTTTPCWRKDKATGEVLCNACGIYLSMNGVRRKGHKRKENPCKPVLRQRIESQSLSAAKFEEIRSYARNLGLHTPHTWRKLYDAGKLEKGMPRDPDIDFTEFWVSWCDFLGSAKWQSFYLAKDFASGLGISCKDDWVTYCSSIKMPLTIPHNPEEVYSSDWRGWEDFLGIQADLTDEQVEEMFHENRCPVCKVSKKGSCGSETTHMRCYKRQLKGLPFEPLSRAAKKYYAILSLRPLGSKYERDKLWEKVHAETGEVSMVAWANTANTTREKRKTKTVPGGEVSGQRVAHTEKGQPTARALAQAKGKKRKVQPNRQQLPDSDSESSFSFEMESDSESSLSEMNTAGPTVWRDNNNKLHTTANGNRNVQPALTLGVGELEDLVSYYMEKDKEVNDREVQQRRNLRVNGNLSSGEGLCGEVIQEGRLSRPSSKPSSRSKALTAEDISRIVATEMEKSKKAANSKGNGSGQKSGSIDFEKLVARGSAPFAFRSVLGL